MLKKAFVVMALSLWAVADPAAACSLSTPVFDHMEPVQPEFTGQVCSPSDWSGYRSAVLTFQRELTQFDKARTLHDFRIRRFDQKLQVKFAQNVCVEDTYEALFEQIEEQNFLNSGPRKAVWQDGIRVYRSELRRANRNISRLSSDPSSAC